MNSPNNETAPARAKRKGWVLMLLGTVALACMAAFAWQATLARKELDGQRATFRVQRGPLLISVTESGTVANRDKVVIKSQVEGKNAILFLAKEGERVAKDDLLVMLDSSRLADQKIDQQIRVQNADASFIGSREDLAVVKSKSESDISKAELDLRFAQLDLKKYLEGEYPQELKKVGAEITIAREEVKRAGDQLDWSTRLAGEGYLTRTELQADELAAKRRALDLELAQSKLGLLKDFTHQKRMDELKSNVEQTSMALERIKRSARANIVQAEANLKAKESEFNRQQDKLVKLGEQIANCRIVAPVEGMVVYATTGQMSWRGNSEPLTEGQEVIQGEELIHLPKATGMISEIKIHETSLKLVQKGQPVRLTVDALPGRVFAGHVERIAPLPDAQSIWMNPDLKVYNSQIVFEDDVTGLRTGMSCRAEIIVEEYADALYVPEQSVLRVGDQPTAYVLKDGVPVPRSLEVGLSNNRMIHVLKGLEAGEAVMLSPPMEPSTRDPSASQQSDEALKGTSPEKPGRPSKKGNKGGAESNNPTADPQAESPKPGLSPKQVSEGKEGAPAPALDREKIQGMSPEQRREWFQNLTPEQREKMRQGGGRRGRGHGGADGLSGGEGGSSGRAEKKDPSGS